MAVKVMCSVCDTFIKDARVVEMRNLTGMEICTDCEKKIEFAIGGIKVMAQTALKELSDIKEDAVKEFSQIEKAFRQATVKIEQTKQKISADMEQARKKVLEPKAKNDT